MQPITLDLAAGLDRSLAWKEGRSVRYLVADLTAHRPVAEQPAAPPLNLALAIDVSGSMAGEKLAAARHTAAEVVTALGPQDRLTLVAFSGEAWLLLAAARMDEAGRERAWRAIETLGSGGNTNLSGGWLLAAEQLAIAMLTGPRASHRVVLLSDGRANDGIISQADLAHHARELLARGIVTSTVGIGIDYDEMLLGVMAEAGGGRLHDAEFAREIGEVVLGELREGRNAALERVRLRVTVSATMRAEVVGPWAHTALPGAIEVVVGTLLPGHQRRVVVRLHCGAGEPGDVLLIGAAANGMLPDGDGQIAARPVEVELRLARGRDNDIQPRDIGRSQAVIEAWHAAVLRKSASLNREGDRLGAHHFLASEIQLMEQYGRGIPGAEKLLADLAMLLRRAGEDWGERTRKEVFHEAKRLARKEMDLRVAERESLTDRLRREQR